MAEKCEVGESSADYSCSRLQKLEIDSNSFSIYSSVSVGRLSRISSTWTQVSRWSQVSQLNIWKKFDSFFSPQFFETNIKWLSSFNKLILINIAIPALMENWKMFHQGWWIFFTSWELFLFHRLQNQDLLFCLSQKFYLLNCIWG